MFQTVKGTYDILPEMYQKFDKVQDLFRNFLDLYDYKLLKTPIFEYTGVFQKENDTSDMVTKEMYSFSPNGKDSYTLRPEGTAGTIRSVVENKLYCTNELPLKLAYIGEMFRHERPQKGRQRQFTQMGVECLGEKSPLLDAETIALGYFFIKALGLNSIKVEINTLGDAQSRLAYKEALKAYFAAYRANLCHDCQQRLDKNPLRILDCKIDGDQDFVKNAPKMQDYLSQEAKAYFAKVLNYLDVLKIPYEIAPSLVRGLDYYTDTVFEVVSTRSESGSQATIFGGGRYDNLVKEMGGIELSGFGFAIGVERLIILGEAEGIFEEYKPDLDAYIVDLSGGNDYVLALAQLLRNNGFRCELNVYRRSLKAQFKSSERKNARFVLIVGEDEVLSKTVNVKDTLTKQQQTVAVAEVIEYLDKHMEEM